MKKVLLVIICLFLLPTVVYAEDCDTSKVTISSITEKNKSGNTIELEEASFKDKTIGVNLSFGEEKDYIEYLVVVKNDSKEDYELDKNSVSLNLDYMEYSLKSTDNSNIIKSGEQKTLLLRIEYAHEVDESKYVDGKYIEEKDLALNLSNREQVVTNPKTKGILIILSIIVGLLVIGTIVVLKGHTKTKLLLIVIALSLPISTLAICKCQLKVSSHIELVKTNEACIYVGEAHCSPVRYYEYQKRYVKYNPGLNNRAFDAMVKGLLAREYTELSGTRFIPNSVVTCQNEATEEHQSGATDYRQWYQALTNCSTNNPFPILDDEEFLRQSVQPKTEGCYDYTKRTLC